MLAAVSGLGATQGQGARPILLDLARSESTVVRHKALVTLASQSGEAVLQALEKALENPLDASAATEALLASSDPEGRVRLLRKLAPLGIEMLEKLSSVPRDLTDDIGRILQAGTDPASRVALIELLTRQPSDQAGLLLEEMLGDNDPWIRRLSLLSLGDRKLGQPSARQFPPSLQQDPDEGVRRTAQLVLSQG